MSPARVNFEWSCVRCFSGRWSRCDALRPSAEAALCPFGPTKARPGSRGVLADFARRQPRRTTLGSAASGRETDWRSPLAIVSKPLNATLIHHTGTFIRFHRTDARFLPVEERRCEIELPDGRRIKVLMRPDPETIRRVLERPEY